MSKEKHLLEEYTPLVHKIAGSFIRKVPRSVLREDLIAAGMSGLWDAISRHPNGGDENFEWYVRVRIRGAIIDELRAQDWLPRRAREAAADNPDKPLAAIVRTDDLSDREQKLIVFQAANAEEELDAHRTRANLLGYVAKLPPRERHIVYEHYFRGVKFKDLGAEMGVSEPRISQLHARALRFLRQIAEGENE